MIYHTFSKRQTFWDEGKNKGFSLRLEAEKQHFFKSYRQLGK